MGVSTMSCPGNDAAWTPASMLGAGVVHPANRARIRRSIAPLDPALLTPIAPAFRLPAFIVSCKDLPPRESETVIGRLLLSRHARSGQTTCRQRSCAKLRCIADLALQH